MGEHSGTRTPAPEREQTVERAEHGDHDDVLDSLIGVTDPEAHGLDQQCESWSTGPRLQLLLEVSAKDELLAESRGRANGDPDGDLRRAPRKEPTDGLRSVWPEKPVRKKRSRLPNDPERNGDRNVARDILRARPPSPHDLMKRRTAAGRERPDIVEECPVEQESGQVDPDNASMLRREAGFWSPLPLKPRAESDSQEEDPYQSCRVPLRGQKAALIGDFVYSNPGAAPEASSASSRS